MQKRCYIDEYFFDRESCAKYYVLGVLFDGVNLTERGFTFSSTSEDLVDIVRREMKIEHAVYGNPEGSSRWMEISVAPYARRKLQSMGLGVPKEERVFPDYVPDDKMHHFMRGFMDKRAYAANINGRLKLEIYFNRRFLSGLNADLRRLAGVQHPEIPHDRAGLNQEKYYHSDTVKIGKFIYTGFSFIERRGLYLPSKKEKFSLKGEKVYADFNEGIENIPKEKLMEKGTRPSQLLAEERMQTVKKLLAEGKSMYEISSLFGYAHPESLYRTFKRITGMTSKEFKESQNKASHHGQMRGV